MSTRSGKRIHKSLHEDVVSAQPKPPCDGKPRSRRLKENGVALNASMPKLKKRVNYVTYPSTDEEPGSGDSGKDAVEPVPPLPPRALRKHALREIDVEPEPQSNVAEPASDSEARPKPTRMTRRTKKFADQNDELPSIQEPEQSEPKRGKRTKKKKMSIDADTNEKENELKDPEPPKKTSKKRKNKKVDEELKSPEIKAAINNSATSMDSFHSAAGSPTPAHTEKLNGTFDKPGSRRSSRSTHDIAKVAEIMSEKVTTESPRRSSIKRNSLAAVKDSAFDNSTNAAGTSSIANTTFDKDFSDKPLNSTFEKTTEGTKGNTSSKSKRLSKLLDTTFEKDSKKLDSTFDKNNDKQSTTSDLTNLTFDKSDENISRISITSDDSKVSSENIMNTTPVLIESSMETSQSLETASPATAAPTTPLKREGTFTKDTSEVPMSPNPVEKTPVQKQMSMPSPGRTPYLSGARTPTRQKRPLNVTHSLEKSSRKLSLADPGAGRGTRVMFCSPVDTPQVDTLRKSKIIKSSMKGSTKTFVFQDTERSGRKRSLAASEAGAPQSGAKRQRLASDMRQSVDRLSRPRTSIAKPDATPSKKPITPAPAEASKSSVKRAKLPNFAALHQKQFARMESLGECQQRRARRAKQLLAPSGSLAVLERSSPKGIATEPPKSTTKDDPTKRDTQKETKAETAKPGYTRFGFKLNLDVNPFSIPRKEAPTTAIKEPKLNGVNPFSVQAAATAVKEPRPNGMKRQHTQPSLVGATSVRKEVAKAVLLREKSATALRERREGKRCETRTIIKGVRTNRRFELQMRSRNI